VAIWQECSPRAKLDLATALVGFLLVAWSNDPSQVQRIERTLQAGQN
jgi:hypothetical protein